MGNKDCTVNSLLDKLFGYLSHKNQITIIIYIFLSNCYKEFFDLCIMGMFDLTSSGIVAAIVFSFILSLNDLSLSSLENKPIKIF
mgnify:CR=1 FL=1